MKIKFLIIFLMFFSLLYIRANKKESYDKNKISFNFNKTASNDQKKTTESNDTEYIKKANGYLTMGVFGIIFVSLAIPASVVFPVLLIYFIPSMAYYIFLLILLPLIPFLGAGVPLTICGFIFYNRNKNKKTPNPFSSNKTSLFKFNISLKGANND
ncbi:MAG: hypothetical protein JXB50_12785 [Spirochaetes bacterium]|nr:hypothetical protein [Spirochaetota bacterium]